MTRITDLEQYIYDRYEVILEYESVVQTTDRPGERRRAQREVDKQWRRIEGLLKEYL